MESPQRRIMRELKNDNDKKFALIIDDIPVLGDEGRQVYVKSQQSKLAAVIYKKLPSKSRSVEFPVDLERYWNYLSKNTKCYGFDFKDYIDIPEIEIKVTVNRAFEVLFIESPAISFVKECVTNAAGRSLNTLGVHGLPSEFWERFKANWNSIQAEFQVTAVRRYINLLSKVMNRKINNKLFSERNRLFKEGITSQKINFLHLFLKTPGLYNPFLEDKQLMYAANGSWFVTGEGNNRLYIRTARDYELYCMTVNDYCKSIGLDRKIGFTSETALFFLFGLLYIGSYNHISVPIEPMKGYLVTDYEFGSNKVARADFLTNDPGSGDGQYERTVAAVNGLDAFILKYGMQLGLQTGMTIKTLKDMLSGAYLERK